MDSTEHFCSRAKTISAPSAGHPQSMLEAYNQMVVNTERNVAKRLGNLERLGKWQQTQFFAVAREEWFRAWNLLAKRHRIDSVLKIRAGKQETLSDLKAAALAMLRISGDPVETLKRHAETIAEAAREGDVSFFRQIGLALRSRARRKPDAGSLTWYLLTHWFAGLLWLMNAEIGVQALASYTGKRFSVGNYRKTARGLGFKDYPGNTKRPPVVAYHPKGSRYVYSPWWKNMEPTLCS